MFKKTFSWIDNNLTTILGAFLLVFIPLYPKLPLFDILPGYIVRVRLEDFFVAFSIAIFVLQILRKKIVLRKDFASFGLLAYLVVGLLSVLVSIFVIQTVPLQLTHVGKTVLHWLRRVEYFSLFFIIFNSIKSIRTAKIFTWLFFIAFVVITVYGFGQKYIAYPYFPAFSTMNREFSKGWVLYLTEHARVLSTFGGHYDLAAYLVMVLSLGWSLFFGIKNKLGKLLMIVLMGAGLWLLILTASRASFIAYLIGVSVVIFVWTLKKSVVWGLGRWLLVMGLSLFVMLTFGDLSDRYAHVFRFSDRFSGIRQLLTQSRSAPPANVSLLENNLSAVAAKSDQPPTPVQNLKPPDVNKNEPPLMIKIKTASGSTEVVQKERTYSQNAVTYDLSAGIRLDATWPKAIAGFKANPFFGSGYGTLTKMNKYDFSEAESTDNDYLRALGETGAFGALAFFGTILVLIWLVFRKLFGVQDNFVYALSAGFMAFSTGLLANAVLLDIFEASKVAYVYWGLTGITLACLYVLREKIQTNMQPFRINFGIKDLLTKIWKFLHRDLFWIGLIVIVSFQLRTFHLDSPVADWHSWRQADTVAVTRDFDRAGSINWLYPTYNDLSSIASGKPNPKGLRYVEFPIYNAMSFVLKKIVPEFSVEAASRIVSNLMWSISLICLFLISRRHLNRRIAYLSAISFAAIPFGIFYGRSILPDPTMVGFSMLTVWMASQFLSNKKIFYLLMAIVFGILALLVKPYAVFIFLLPVVYLWWQNYRFSWKKWIGLFLILGLMVVPFFAWRQWMSQFPEGIPANDWLFNGDGIRLKGAFFYWLFADRIGRLILGYWGLALLVVGIIRKYESKASFLPLTFFIGTLAYLVTIATGNVRHDYYQILLVPSLALLVGGGLEFLLFNKIASINLWLSRVLGIVSFTFMIAFGWYFVKDLFNINHPEIVLAGKAVEKVTRDRALVIAPYMGDTAFLYQTNRKGWPIMEGDITHMISLGADYYVSTNYDDLTKSIIAEANGKNYREFKIIEMKPEYVIIQLVPDSKLPNY